MTDRSVQPGVLGRLRHRVGPRLDRLAETLGSPTVHVYPPGYVATVHLSIGTVEAELRGDGFTWDPLSTYHYPPAGSSTNGSWAYRSGWFADR